MKLAAQHSRRRTRPRTGSRGFTLIEASLATVIIGIGFLATLQLIAAGTASNVQGAEMTTGVNLARNIREMSLQKKFIDLPALNGASYMPPKDSRSVDLPEFPNWQQVITVQTVDPTDLTREIVVSPPQALRLTVQVNHNGHNVSTLSWYSFERN